MTYEYRGAYGRRAVPGSQSFDRTRGTVIIGTLAGTRLAKGHPGCLIAPLDLDPHAMQWPVKDAGIVLFADRKNETFSTNVVRALLDDGAELVCRIFIDDWTSTVHRPAPKESPPP